MPEIKSWDTVFFVKAANQNIGVRVYYEIDTKECTITYAGQTREFGTSRLEYIDNPNPGDVTTYSYEFKVVAGKQYLSQEKHCMDILVDAIQSTELKGPAMSSTSMDFIDDGREHRVTITIPRD